MPKERYEIIYDEYADNPRTWSPTSIFIFAHKNYDSLGDFNFRYKEQIDDYIKEHKEDIAWAKKHGLYTDVYMMDHSGLSLSRTPFQGMYGYFDSGQVGFMYMPRSSLTEYHAKKMGSRIKEQLHNILDIEFNAVNDYVQGDTYILYDNEEDAGISSGSFMQCKEEKEKLEELLMVKE